VAHQQELLAPPSLLAVQIQLPRAATVVDALLERLLERLPQRRHLVIAQRVDAPQRVDPRLEKRILDVDGAATGDALLVEQERLDRPPPPTQECPELVERQVFRTASRRESRRQSRGKGSRNAGFHNNTLPRRSIRRVKRVGGLKGTRSSGTRNSSSRRAPSS